jgi:hypothetical protein
MAPEIIQLLNLLYGGTSDLSDQEVRMKLLYKCAEEKRCYYKYNGNIKAWEIRAYTPEEIAARARNRKARKFQLQKKRFQMNQEQNKKFPNANLLNAFIRHLGDKNFPIIANILLETQKITPEYDNDQSTVIEFLDEMANVINNCTNLKNLTESGLQFDTDAIIRSVEIKAQREIRKEAKAVLNYMKELKPIQMVLLKNVA